MASLCAGNGKMNKGMVEWTNMSIINRYKKLKNEWRKYEYIKKKCKINFNKPLALTINNLLKPLLSKPETILIQKSIKRYPPPNVQRNMQQPFLEVTTRTWPHTKQRVFRHPQKSNLQVRLFLFSKDDLRSKKDKLRLNFVQWELSLKSLFLYARSL